MGAIDVRVPRKALGFSGILIGISFVLMGGWNCLLILGDSRDLGVNSTTLVVSAIFAVIGLTLLPLSARFALGRRASAKWVTIGFVVYACVLTVLSLMRTWQLDADTILDAEVAIMVALIGASASFKGRMQGLLAGVPLLYLTVLLTLVEGFSTAEIFSFGTTLTPPSLGLLFSWRPFEIAALLLASLASFAKALKKRIAVLAFLSLLSYSLGVLAPLFLPSTGALTTLSMELGDLSILNSPKLLGILLLAAGNVLAAVTAVAGLARNRRRFPATAGSQVSPTAGPRPVRSYCHS